MDYHSFMGMVPKYLRIFCKWIIYGARFTYINNTLKFEISGRDWLIEWLVFYARMDA